MKVKPWYKSSTILWSLFSLLVTIGLLIMMWVLNIKHEDSIFSLLVANIISNIQTIRGRIKATHKIVISKKQVTEYDQNISVVDLVCDVVDLFSKFVRKK